MSVGILLTNGLEAIIIADGRAISDDKKQPFDKLKIFSHDAYHGAICGVGFTSDIDSVFERSRPCKDLPRLVECLKENVRKNVPTKDGATFIFSGYDKETREIVSLRLTKKTNHQIWMPYHCIGIGSTEANNYFKEHVGKVSVESLSMDSLLFHALNAYSHSTLIESVGHTPKIVLLSKDASFLLPVEKTIACINLAGAYLVDYHPNLSQDKTQRYFKEIVGKEEPNYVKIAKNLTLDAQSFTTLLVPYSSWQETADRMGLHNQ